MCVSMMWLVFVAIIQIIIIRNTHEKNEIDEQMHTTGGPSHQINSSNVDWMCDCSHYLDWWVVNGDELLQRNSAGMCLCSIPNWQQICHTYTHIYTYTYTHTHTRTHTHTHMRMEIQSHTHTSTRMNEWMNTTFIHIMKRYRKDKNRQCITP